MPFKREQINIDPETETQKIIENIKATVSQTLRRKGAVVGISGGIDSSVVLALCVRALGEKRVLGVMLPEKTPVLIIFAWQEI